MTKPDLDKKVLKLMANVEERRKRVGALKKPSWKTSCSLGLPGHDRINLHVCKDLSLLVYAYGILRSMRVDFVAAAREMDLAIDLDTKWQSYSIDEWMSDIKQRCRIIQIKAEQKKLTDMETKLKGLVSEDQRREMALDKLEKELEE